MSKEEILAERARKLAERSDEKSTERVPHILFMLGKETYAVPHSFLEEVVKNEAITPIPNTPAHFLGVTNIRQRVVSVVDLKRLFVLREEEAEGKNPKILVLKHQDNEFALLVDQIIGSEDIEVSAIQSPPEGLDGLQKESTKGVTQKKQVILNAEILFQKKDFIVNSE